jgi:hypothetical protein
MAVERNIPRATGLYDPPIRSYIEDLTLLDIGIITGLGIDPGTGAMTVEVRTLCYLGEGVQETYGGVELILAGMPGVRYEIVKGVAVLLLRPRNSMMVADQSRISPGFYSAFGMKAIPIYSPVAPANMLLSSEGLRGQWGDGFRFAFGLSGAGIGDLLNIGSQEITVSEDTLRMRINQDEQAKWILWFDATEKYRALWYLDQASGSMFRKERMLVNINYDNPEVYDPTAVLNWQRVEERASTGVITEKLNVMDGQNLVPRETRARDAVGGFTRQVTDGKQNGQTLVDESCTAAGALSRTVKDAQGHVIITDTFGANGAFMRDVTQSGGTSRAYKLTAAATGAIQLVVTNKLTLSIDVGDDGKVSVSLSTDGDMSLTANKYSFMSPDTTDKGKVSIAGDVAISGNLVVTKTLSAAGNLEVAE